MMLGGFVTGAFCATAANGESAAKTATAMHNLDVMSDVSTRNKPTLSVQTASNQEARSTLPAGWMLAILVKGPKERPGKFRLRKRSSSSMKSIFERLRTRRLASTFVVLATLSAAIVFGSYLAHGVRGQ